MKLSPDLIHELEKEYSQLMSATFAQVNEKQYTFNAGKMAMISHVFEICGMNMSVAVKAGEIPIPNGLPKKK